MADLERAEENPFYDKVDLTNIALIGHSRGGEAVVHAAAFNRLSHYPDNATVSFDFDFAIKTLIAIAPIDGQYEPVGQPTPVENVNYLVIHGSHDGDVDFFAGARTYRRVKFTDRNYWMKSAMYVHRANHGQFNTVWGPYDVGPPLSHFLARGTLLSPQDQRRSPRCTSPRFWRRRCAAGASTSPCSGTIEGPPPGCPRRSTSTGSRIPICGWSATSTSRSTSPRQRWRAVFRRRRIWACGDTAGWKAATAGPSRTVPQSWAGTRWARRSRPAHAPSYTIILPDDLAHRWRIDAQTFSRFAWPTRVRRARRQKDDRPAAPSDPNVTATPGAEHSPPPGPGQTAHRPDGRTRRLRTARSHACRSVTSARFHPFSR